MTEELEQLLRNLRLKRILEIYDAHLKVSEKEDVTYTDFLLGLLRPNGTPGRREPGLAHQESRSPRTVDSRHLPLLQTARGQPASDPRLRRTRLHRQSREHRLVGPTGVGKTGLASGLLLKALQNGYRGQFIRAQDLFDEMYASLADRSSRRLVNRLARLDVLHIDELGYVNCRPEQANIFFKLMEERYHRKATLITTNLPYDEWHNVLGNKPMVDALLSRLRHYCHTVTIKGPSLRAPQG